MQLKDYYQLLKLEPSATIAEIKKAYRKLAHLYHPDKNNNDPYSIAQFADIKEAYEVLTDPAKKEYYLQQRWYNQSIGKKTKQEVITPVSILKQSLELERYVSKIDIFRMDSLGLQQFILDLLSDSTIEKLLLFNEPHIISQTISIIGKSMKPLPGDLQKKIILQLNKLANNDQTEMEKIGRFVEHGKKKKQREKLLPFIVLFITIIICLLIFLVSK
jgi:curved DNA-binding protein CbpA